MVMGIPEEESKSKLSIKSSKPNQEENTFIILISRTKVITKIIICLR